MERLIRLLALTLSFVALLYMTGFRADRALTRPGAPATTQLESSRVVSGHRAPGLANAGGLYRGHTAAYWAAFGRHRTRQLQAARASSRRAIRATIKNGYGTSWLERAFLCIHRYEGSWTDSGAPYWGGLQMDGDFMRHYGGWALKAFGTADKWPVSVQISTAIQAKVSGRGFYPWPNTARACGLL